MNRQRTAIALVAALIVVAVVVGVTQRGSSSLGSAATEAVSSEARGGSARTLPAFEGRLFGGGTLKASDIDGPAVIHVYGSWCPTCQREAPAFAQLQRENPDLDYYYIAVNDDERATAEFVEASGWKAGPTIDDPDREVEQALGLTGQPHTIFVNADGEIAVHQGPGSFGELNELAAQLT